MNASMSIPLIIVSYQGLPRDDVIIRLDAEILDEEQFGLNALRLEVESAGGNAGHCLIGYVTQLELIIILITER
jgi:hypothetical protein